MMKPVKWQHMYIQYDLWLVHSLSISINPGSWKYKLMQSTLVLTSYSFQGKNFFVAKAYQTYIPLYDH